MTTFVLFIIIDETKPHYLMPQHRYDAELWKQQSGGCLPHISHLHIIYIVFNKIGRGLAAISASGMWKQHPGSGYESLPSWKRSNYFFYKQAIYIHTTHYLSGVGRKQPSYLIYCCNQNYTAKWKDLSVYTGLVTPSRQYSETEIFTR